MSGFSLTALLTAVSLVFTGISASAADGDLPPELQGLGLYEDILPIGSDGTGGASVFAARFTPAEHYPVHHLVPA